MAEAPVTAPAAEDRGSSDAPVRRLTVLYDQECPLCRHVRGWLERQRQLVPLEFVPAGSPQARQRFPVLDHARTLREITVIGDSGQVYEGAAAWVVCLWALAGHRTTAHRFSTPSGAHLARGMVLTAAKWREVGKAPRSPEAPVLAAQRRAAAARNASGRPTAQGRAGRPGPLPVPTVPWVWDGRQWRPGPVPAPAPVPALTPAPIPAQAAACGADDRCGPQSG